MKKFPFIKNIIFTIMFIISLILDIVFQAWALVILSGICLILEIITFIIDYRKWRKTNESIPKEKEKSI